MACHIVVAAGERVHKSPKLGEAVVIKAAGRRVVLVAQERRGRDGGRPASPSNLVQHRLGAFRG
jgi:hypothetical protein